MSERFEKILKTLGPGLIFAGTSIGVSHIVQSTRAGALYGFGLLGAVLFANIFKFPFFEFGPRYVNATGEHLLHGYRRVGSWAFYLFFILSLCTMFPIQSAVTLVTTGLFVNILGWTFEPYLLSAVILSICCVILLAGKYPLLDKLMKVMIIFLGLSTVLALGAAILKGSQAQAQYSTSFQWDLTGVSFLIALIGWMPTTLEISVWHSFWCSERRKQTNHRPSMKHALIDFHLGYWGTMVMAIFFLSLGALVMYGTGEVFSNSAVKFTGQVLSLYSSSLGSWSYWLIAIAAGTTMFSTTICCLDAFPRVIREFLVMVNPSLESKKDSIYCIALIVISIIAVFIIGGFQNKMKLLIDFATTLAFLATPIFAYINLRVVTCSYMPQEARPSKLMICYSWLCLGILTIFGLVFLYWRLFLK